MKFVTLKSFDKKKLLISTLIITSLILVITIFISHAEFTSTDHVTIVDGVINYTPYDFKMMAMYQQKEDCEDSSSDACYTEIEKMPSEGYEINQEKSYCFVDDDSEKIKNKVYTNSDGEHVISSLPKRSKCIIYFNKKKEDVLMKYVLANTQGNTAHFTGASCSDGCSLTENGIYEAPDENGTTSYYFRGTIENNYVKFGTDSTGADIWWRIIRINGDGSIRMMYAGTSTNGSVPDQTSSYYTMINNGRPYDFNDWGETAEDVGYQYSNAKTVLEKWFSENLTEEYQSGYIDKNAGFCGDRTTYRREGTYPNNTYTRDDSLGTGTQTTYYGGYIRTYVTYEPTFLCEDKEHDLYTVEETSEGTQNLTYPVGLITVDEQVYAGNHSSENNTKSYLYTGGGGYWTMSPSEFVNGEARVFVVDYGEGPSSALVNYYDNINGLRPVINLVAGSLTSGDGTAGNPYTAS